MGSVTVFQRQSSVEVQRKVPKGTRGERTDNKFTREGDDPRYPLGRPAITRWESQRYESNPLATHRSNHCERGKVVPGANSRLELPLFESSKELEVSGQHIHMHVLDLLRAWYIRHRHAQQQQQQHTSKEHYLPYHHMERTHIESKINSILSIITTTSPLRLPKSINFKFRFNRHSVHKRQRQRQQPISQTDSQLRGTKTHNTDGARTSKYSLSPPPSKTTSPFRYRVCLASVAMPRSTCTSYEYLVTRAACLDIPQQSQRNPTEARRERGGDGGNGRGWGVPER